MQPFSNSVHSFHRQPPDPFHQFGFIDRENLRYIHDTRLRQVGIALAQGHVSRSVRPARVRRDQADHTGRDTARIEQVALHHNARMTLRWGGSGHRPEIEPERVSLANPTRRFTPIAHHFSPAPHQFSTIVPRNFAFSRFAMSLSALPASSV